jgi:hypothetical protein
MHHCLVAQWHVQCFKHEIVKCPAISGIVTADGASFGLVKNQRDFV